MGKGLSLAWGLPICARGHVKWGRGTQPAGAPKTGAHRHTLHGAVTEATEEVGCPATMPCPPHPSYGHFCPESSVPFLDCVHV